MSTVAWRCLQNNLLEVDNWQDTRAGEQVAVWDASPPPLPPGGEKTQDFGRFSGRRPSHRSNQLHLHTPLRVASHVTQGSRQESWKGHKGSLKRQVTTQGTQRRMVSKFCMDAGFLSVVENWTVFHDQRHWKTISCSGLS